MNIKKLGWILPDLSLTQISEKKFRTDIYAVSQEIFIN